MYPRRAVISYSLGGFAVGVSASAAYLYYKRQLPVQRPPLAPPDTQTALLEHPTSKYGWPVYDSVRSFENFVVAYDTRLRHARWVLEHINKDKLKGDGTRNTSFFYEDAGVDARFRSKLSDYKNTGYDRGHMAPAANHKASQDTMDSTFTLSNCAPQVGQGFNRDYWARFERFVQQVAHTSSDVWVVTGPLYLPSKTPEGGWVMQHPMLGTPPRMMGVPTHFFKVVLAEPAGRGGKQNVVGAFVMPNSVIDPTTPLASFVVPISALEEVSGVQFFPSWLTDDRRKAIDEIALEWQRHGNKLIGPGKDVKLLPPPLDAPPATPGPLVKLPRAALHLCDHTGCQLPVPDWWDKDKKQGRPPLRRTTSAPLGGLEPNGRQS